MANLRDKLRDRQPPRKGSNRGRSKAAPAPGPGLEYNPRLLMIAAGIAGLAALLAVFYLLDISAGIAGRGAKKEVWVTRQALAARHQITAADVKERAVPLNFLADGYLPKDDSPVGKVTLAPLARGEILLEVHVADAGQATGVTPMLKADERGFVLVPSTSQDAPLVKPDDRVDLIATLPESGNSRQMISTQVLQRVRVLSVGDRMSSDASASGDPQANGGALTLAVPADKVALLTILKQEGNLHIDLRAPGDDTIVTPAIPESQIAALVMGQIPRPKPHIQAPPPRPRVITQYVTHVIKVRAPRPVVRPRPRQPTIQIYNGTQRQN